MYHRMKQKHISVFAHTIFTFMLLADFPLYRLFLTRAPLGGCLNTPPPMRFFCE